METVNQKIERARAYLADIHAGHVSMAGESAPFTTLTGHLEVLLGIIDDQHLAYPAPEGEQARLRAELLAEVPARDRGYALTQAVATDLSRHPGDSIVVVTRWLRDARLQGGASAAAAALTETADWIDAQLEDETASRQVIAGQASARMKTAAAQLLAAAGLDRPAGNEAGQ